MIRRAVVLPADANQVWEAITDPERLAGWLGSGVDWDLRPGGAASFRSRTDGDRAGVVAEVEPPRRLRFRWWPEADEGDVSEVTWDLEADGPATRLTVTERPVEPVPAAQPGVPTARAGVTGWGRSDDEALAAWTRAARVMLAVG